MYGQITDSQNPSRTFGRSYQAPVFVQAQPNGLLKCHGRVTEFDHHEVFYSKTQKRVNSIFRGEPYQIGHQTAEYVMRIEELDGGYTSQKMDFYLFGNYMGRIHAGDEVIVMAKQSRDRNIVTSIYNVTTGLAIDPGIQVPANAVRGMYIGLILLLGLVAYLIYDFVSSGKFMSFMIYAVLGLIIFCVIRNKIRGR